MAADKKGLIAKQLFERGKDALSKGNFDYAIDCFFNCSKLCPDQLIYRQALRGAERKKYKDNGTGARMIVIRTGAAKMALKKAKSFKKWPEVMEAAEECLKFNPWDTAMLAEVAAACLELELYDVGIWVQETALEIDNKNAGLFRLLIDLYEADGQYTKAANACEVVRQLDPNDQVVGQRGRELAAQATLVNAQKSKERRESGEGDAPDDKAPSESPEQAQQRELKELKQKAMQTGDDPDLFVRLGDKYRKMRDYENAIGSYKRAFDIDDNSDVKIKMYDCQIEAMRFAIESVRGKMEKFDKKQPDAAEKFEQLKLKLKELQQRMMKAEVNMFRLKAESNPEDFASFFELGYRMLQVGQFDEAVKALQVGRNDNKKRWESLCWLGVAFWKKNNHALADRNLAEAMEAIGPTDENARKQILYYRGCVAQDRKDYPSASEYFNEIAAIDYGYKDVSKRLDQLNNITA